MFTKKVLALAISSVLVAPAGFAQSGSEESAAESSVPDAGGESAAQGKAAGSVGGLSVPTAVALGVVTVPPPDVPSEPSRTWR